MDWPFASVCEPLRKTVGGIYDAIRRESRKTDVRALITPIEPFNRSRIFSPVVAAAGVVSVVMLSGIALGAIVTAAAALAAVYYLLTQVFGYELTLAVPTASS
jgi:hypothetical protein